MPSEIAVFKTPSEDAFEVIVGDNRYIVYDLPLPDDKRCRFVSVLEGKPLPLFGIMKLTWKMTPQRVGDIVVGLVCNACQVALRRREPDREKAFDLLKGLQSLVATR